MLKEFILNIRNFKTNSMMVLFPIVLIIILGSAFSGAFDRTFKLGDVKVLYTIDTKEVGHLATAFGSFRADLSKELGIRFEEIDNVDMGMSRIKNYQYAAYVYVNDITQEIKLYKNERYGFNASLLESALNSFIKSYGTMSTIAQNNPAALAMPQMREHESYIKVRALDKKRQPGSMDYYTITMLTMILLYASLTGFWSIRGDIEGKTASRTLCAPVRSYERLTGNVMGCILVTLVQGPVVILFSKFLLKAYWGEDMVTVALLLLTYSIMAISLGVGLAYLFKNGEAASGILNTIIPIFVFLGGGYVPLDVAGPGVAQFSSISPVKWINSALFSVIYDKDYSQVAISAVVNLTVATAFILVAALFSRREAV